MAYAMTKRGSMDNVVTYEFICDTLTDMNAIENTYRTLGSVAIVLSGESEGLEVYIAGSNRQWNSLGAMGGSSSSAAGLVIYICSQNEYDANTLLPTVQTPDETTLYLVPASAESGNLYDEYVYVNDAWERFGGANINLSNYVQKTDIATQSTAGLVKVLDNGNVTFNENNQLVLTLAGTAVVKTGQSDHPISVTHQHEAAFYGLAKAAGQDMKNSGNAVGTYTTEAASAIRTMIGAGTYSKPAGGIPAADLAETYLTAHQDISGKANVANPVFTGTLSQNRKANTTVGNDSVTLGAENTASGPWSLAEGWGSTASGAEAHAEGYSTTASGLGSHAEGSNTTASNNNAHAEGYGTIARGSYAHAEGMYTVAASYAHAEGYLSRTDATYTVNNTAYALGATGDYSHSEGDSCGAVGSRSHAENTNTLAVGQSSHAEGEYTYAYGQGSHAEGKYTSATGKNAHAEGSQGYAIDVTLGAVGDNSHSEGYLTTSAGISSHAEGDHTRAGGQAAHAEGYYTATTANYAHAEGQSETNAQRSIGNTVYTLGATGVGSHVEGYKTGAKDQAGHAEGYNTLSLGQGSHTEGRFTYASGTGAHAEGYNTVAMGNGAHAEGQVTSFNINKGALSTAAHVEGSDTTASGYGAHAEGCNTLASGMGAHAEGNGGTFTMSGTQYTSGATASYAHSEGDRTLASGSCSHAEGAYNIAKGNQAHAEGTNNLAQGNNSHAEGAANTTYGAYSHVEGQSNRVTSDYGHAEGAFNNVYAQAAHAEGYHTQVTSPYGHVEGYYSNAYGTSSHAEGDHTMATNNSAHSEGISTQALGEASHAEGYYTRANRAYSHVSGMYNTEDNFALLPEWTANTAYVIGNKVRVGTASGYVCITANNDAVFTDSKWQSIQNSQPAVLAEIVGNGTAENARSNARALDWNGNEYLKGDLYIHCNADSTGGTAISTLIAGYESRIAALEAQVASLIAALQAQLIETEVVLENGEPLTDENGNLLEYDLPTT